MGQFFSAKRLLSALTLLLGSILCTAAAAPPEVSAVAFSDSATLVWDSATGADFYHVYHASARRRKMS